MQQIAVDNFVLTNTIIVNANITNANITILYTKFFLTRGKFYQSHEL